MNTHPQSLIGKVIENAVPCKFSSRICFIGSVVQISLCTGLQDNDLTMAMNSVYKGARFDELEFFELKESDGYKISGPPININEGIKWHTLLFMYLVSHLDSRSFRVLLRDVNFFSMKRQLIFEDLAARNWITEDAYIKKNLKIVSEMQEIRKTEACHLALGMSRSEVFVPRDLIYAFNHFYSTGLLPSGL